MPWFEYEGISPGGTAVTGRIEAADGNRAQADLAQMQVEVRGLQQVKQPPKRVGTISEGDLIFFNQQLASLAEAGIALDAGLKQLARDIESPKLKKWIDRLADDLRRGMSLEQAVAANERGLPMLYSQVIRAGIETGELPATLLNLNQHLQLAGKTRRLFWEVVSYPLLVGFLGLAVFSGFFTIVVPHFREIFDDFGAELPGITLLVLDLSEHFLEIVLGLLAVLFACTLGWQSLRWSKTGLAVREQILLGLPGVGRLYRASIVARFLRSMATAVGSGLPLPQALRTGSSATGSPGLIRDAAYLASEVEQGHSVFTASQSLRLIPSLLGFSVEVARGRDALPTTLAQLARSYENRAVYSLAALRTILFPVTIILLGAFMLLGTMGLFLPLVHGINAVSSGG